jgi:hypothetical protein
MNRQLPDETKVSLKRLCTAAEKLLQETERLRRDVLGLNQRVQPIGDMGTDKGWIEQPPAERKVWKAVDALNLINETRTNILNCEHELSAIRARIDAIELQSLGRK